MHRHPLGIPQASSPRFQRYPRGVMRESRNKLAKLLLPQSRQRTARRMLSQYVTSGHRNLDSRIRADRQTGHRIRDPSGLRLVVPSPETFISFVRRGVEKAEASDYSPTVAEMQLGKFPGPSVRCSVKSATAATRFCLAGELKTAATAGETTSVWVNFATAPAGPGAGSDPSGRLQQERCIFFPERDMRHLQIPLPVFDGPISISFLPATPSR